MKYLRCTLIVALLNTATGCSRSASEHGTAAVAVRTPALTTQRAESSEDASGFVGVVLPELAVEVSAQLEGQVHSVGVSLGDRVTRGHILAQISPGPQVTAELAIAEFAAKSAAVDVQRAITERNQLLRRRDRAKTLFDQQLVSAADVDDASFDLEVAGAKQQTAEHHLAQREALVAQHRAAVALATVRSPSDGVVSTAYVDAGANVGRGTPIVRIIDTRGLKVRFGVPAANGLERVGTPVVVVIEGLVLRLDGTITAVSPEVDTSSQLRIHEAKLSISDLSATIRQLAAGRSATVRIVGIRNDAGRRK